jgi:hypothetical protein
MIFDDYIDNAQAIFDGFPNEQVWIQGGFAPNRQLQKPEAGFCIVLRYDDKTTSAISRFMTKVRTILPPIVEYDERNFHSTIGVYGKRNLHDFVPESTTLKLLKNSVEKGLALSPQNPHIEFGKWLYNNEAILLSGYPNQALWELSQNINHACRENGYALEMGRIIHITTARFISGVTSQVFEQFTNLMKSAPFIKPTKPSALDLATWRCDGLTFDLDAHHRYRL